MQELSTMQEQRIKDSQTQLQLYLEHNNTRGATTPTSNSIRNSRGLYGNRERYGGLLPQEKKFKQYGMMIEKTTSLLIESDSIEKLQLILSLNLSLMIWNASSYLSRKMFKKSGDSYSKIENEDDGLPIEQTIFERSTNRNIYLNKVLQKMTDSTTTTQGLKAKLFEFQKLGIVIERNAKGYNYKYSSYDYIREKIGIKLNELKILVSHKIQDYGGILYLETTISDMESDDSQTSAIPIAQNLTPQSMGSSITYYKRYNLGALLNLIIEGEDDDGAAAEKKTTTQKKADSTQKPQFLDANFEKFKQWTKGKDLEQITIKKDEILAKYTVSEEMCKKLDDFLFNL